MPLDEQIVNNLRAEILKHLAKVRSLGANASNDAIIQDLPITYGDLICRAGLNLPPQGIGRHLSAIGERCTRNGQPRLDYLVVRKRTGRPGFQHSEGAWKVEVMNSYRCHAYEA